MIVSHVIHPSATSTSTTVVSAAKDSVTEQPPTITNVYNYVEMECYLFMSVMMAMILMGMDVHRIVVFNPCISVIMGAICPDQFAVLLDIK